MTLHTPQVLTLPSLIPVPMSRSQRRRFNPQQNLTTSRKSRLLYTLHCKCCQSLLSITAEKACLISSVSIKLFSATLVTGTVQPTFITTTGAECLCMCDRSDVACSTCGNDFGYVVVKICRSCNKGDHNGHRFVFYPKSVHAHETGDNRPRTLPDVPER